MRIELETLPNKKEKYIREVDERTGTVIGITAISQEEWKAKVEELQGAYTKVGNLLSRTELWELITALSVVLESE